MFSQLLYQDKKAVFINETQTYYRQYESNTAGLGNNSLDSIKNGIEVKKKHYQCMKQIDVSFERFFFETKLLEVKIDNADFIFNKIENDDLFWWENTNYIIYN